MLPQRNIVMKFGRLIIALAWALWEGLAIGAISAEAKTHEVEMTAVESDVIVDGGGMTYKAWTFNGQIPGPVGRVTEGDTVKFTLHNPKTNTYPHAMDFHAAEIDFLKNYARSMQVSRSVTPLWPESPASSFTIAARRR